MSIRNRSGNVKLGILMLIFLILYLLIAVFVFLVLYFFIQGAIYVPTPFGTIEKMIKLVKPGKNDRLADLGSGDGRIVIAFAQKGITAEGFEINPLLVWYSRWKIRKLKLDRKAKIYWRSFWQADLSKYNIIIVFGIDHIMKRLGKKLKKELNTGSKILVNIFPFTDWQFKKKIDGIYFYEK